MAAKELAINRQMGTYNLEVKEKIFTSHIPETTMSVTAELRDAMNVSNMTLRNGSDENGVYGLPKEMIFGDQHIISVVAYSCFFLIAASGNLTVFITLFRNRGQHARVNMFIMHLSLADLIVTFIMMPLEIGWNSTVDWRAGDFGCRILMFFRVFGLYLSSFVLVVISLDRYFAILHPLSLNDADKRGQIMLVFAWLFSIVVSLPQSVIFHVEGHPDFPWFKQCVTFNFFPTPTHKLIYNLFHMLAMYGLPLVIMTLSYTLILIEISKKTRQSREEMQELNSTQKRNRLRRSAVGNIERARSRTLKMTIVIVSVFIFCWTPYFVLAVWWWFDSESAKTIDARIQKGLFMFAVSNSCMNPIVYGLFTINFKREFVRCCCCFRSNWSQKKLIMAFTRNYFWRTHQKSPYTRTSYSSVRSPYSSSLSKFNNNGRVSRNPSCVRYNCKLPNNVCVGYNKNHIENAVRHKQLSNGVVGNHLPSSFSNTDLNRFGVVRSKSDSGIALKTFTPTVVTKEEGNHSASV